MLDSGTAIEPRSHLGTARARRRPFAALCALNAAFICCFPLAIAPAAAVAATPVPLVMLAMSRDEQYFFKAYNDYTDLDGDGTPERAYKDSIPYYG